MKRNVFLKSLLFAALLLFAADQVSALDNVVISKVFYDPVDESGSEAIELYNPTEGDVNVSGWVISTETSVADATIPDGTILRSNSYYLIADAGWSTAKSADWPEADHEEAVTLTNSNAGLALMNRTQAVDAVGWGTASDIGSGLYEGTPHSGVEQGEILMRKIESGSYRDTNDNSADFVSGAPSFKRAGPTQPNGGHQISIQLVVEGNPMSVVSASINADDDSFKEGIQINPVPKNLKEFEVEAIVSHVRGADNIKKVKATLNGVEHVMTAESLDSNSARYKTNVSMNYYDASDNYSISIGAEATDGNVTSAELDFEYASLTAMEVDTFRLNFSSEPGSQSEIAGDTNMSSATKATLRNIGNTVLDLELLGTNLTNTIGSVSVGNITYAFNNDYAGSLSGSLSEAKQKKSVGIGVSQTMPLSFRMNVPQSAEPGSYKGTITLIAVGR